METSLSAGKRSSGESTVFQPNTTSFSPEILRKLKDIMYEQTVAAGSFLFWEGDPAEKLYFIKRGSVKVTKSTDHGRDFVFYIFQRGDLFGEFSGAGKTRHSFNAEAIEDAVVGVIQNRDLEILLWQHGEVAIEFMKWMDLLQRTTQAKFRDLMLYGKPGALCSTLIRLCNTCGRPTQEGILITKKLTNSELADMIGATRECVNRLLGDLKSKRVIAYEKGLIVIKNIEYLKEICHCEGCPAEVCRI
ncbi:fumarate/nitrate reduction transcriptional regulator Fnr [Bacillaceae bacterium]